MHPLSFLEPNKIDHNRKVIESPFSLKIDKLHLEEN